MRRGSPRDQPPKKPPRPAHPKAPSKPAPAEREVLPPLDTIRPEHVAYVRALIAKFTITPTHHREDLVQEILIEAHRSKRSTLEPRALLFGITRHVAYRWIASHQQEQTALAAQQREAVDEEEAYPSAEDEWQAAERREVVRASIDELPDSLRDVFVRVEEDEMTMPEAAKDLGIPVNTGYSRLHVARQRFAELLNRLLKRRRTGREDLAPIALLAGSDDAGALRARDVRQSSPRERLPDVARPSTLPVTLRPSWLPHLPWGATEALLLGGAFAASLVVLPLDPAPPAVVVEPEAPATPLVLRGPTSAPPEPSAEPQPSPGPLSVTGSSPPAPPLAPPAPSPTHAPVAPSASASDIPHSRSHPDPSSGPSSQAARRPAIAPALRSDGAWARDIAKLALAGDRAAAAAELAAFRKAYPNSTYITRLESMVATVPKPAPSAASPSTDTPAPGSPPRDP